MTSEIEKKALALVNEVETERGYPVTVKYAREKFSTIEALCRAIEQHEALRQEVSDAVAKVIKWGDPAIIQQELPRFIIAEPDPLVEVMNEMGFGWSKTASEEFRAALAARGLKIVEAGHD